MEAIKLVALSFFKECELVLFAVTGEKEAI